MREIKTRVFTENMVGKCHTSESPHAISCRENVVKTLVAESSIFLLKIIDQ